MITTNEAIAIIDQQPLSEWKKAWARRMISDVAGNALDRELILDYVLGAEMKSAAREQLIREGNVIDGKPHPALKIYDAGVKRLAKLAKLLDMMGVAPFEDA